MGPPTSRTSLIHISTVPFSLKYIEGQARFLSDRGFDVHIVASPGSGLQEFGAREDVPIHAISMRRKISPLDDIRSVRLLIQLIHELRPAIVHAQTPKAGLLGMLSAWMTRTPVRIYSMLGLTYMTAEGNRRRLLQWTERISCSLAHEILCVGPSLRDVAVRDGICSPSKIRVLCGGSVNGIDANCRFNPEAYEADRRSLRRALGISPDHPVLGFVGRIVQDKGVVELQEAWRTLRRRFQTAHMIIIGPFEERGAIPTAVRSELETDPRVHVLGSIEDVAPYYSAMDLFVLPSYREGLPNVLLEAASMELPVVATNIPGCCDAVVDGVTGTLVPVRDAAALADTIECYLKNPALRRQHGLEGRARVLRDFRQEAIWEAVYQMYCTSLKAKGIRAPHAYSASRD